VDPQLLLERAAGRVVAHVQRDEAGWPDAEEAADRDQDAGSDDVVDELVEEGRLELRVRLVPRNAVHEVDLQAPRQARRLAVQLLVPPVAPAADALREEQAGRNGVHEALDAVPGAAHDDGACERAEEDPAPHAEAALPDGGE